MTNLRKILEEYRRNEWICTNDKTDTDEKINHNDMEKKIRIRKNWIYSIEYN